MILIREITACGSTHADHEAGGERLDMDVACAQLDRLLQEVVDRAHDRRAAGKVAQAFNVVLAQLRQPVRIAASLGLVGDEALVQDNPKLVESGDPDLDVRPKHDLGGALRGDICGVRDGKDSAAILGLEGKDQGLAQKALREGRDQRGGRQHVLQCNTLAAEKASRLIGEFARRQRGHLPRLGKRGRLRVARTTALRLVGDGGIRDLRGLSRLQVPGPAKVLDEWQWLMTGHASFPVAPLH
jgi:hypothetical protein